MMSSPTVRRVSECFIKPLQAIEGSNQNHICYLTPWDITMLSMNYIQKGLLFKKPSSISIDNLLEKLKHSLSLALFHFYPLAGRLVTQKIQHPPYYSIFVDCKNTSATGAKFIYATSDNITISNILSPVDFPPILHSLFDLNRAINHDGHTLPLLSIQVTQLLDGVFIGCSMNHCIGDGTSYWNFFNTWSHIFQFQDVPILHPPLHNRWFPEGCAPPINLPFKHHDEFIIDRYESPKLRERIFHFSAESIAKLKAKANTNRNSTKGKISSFQSLSAHVWRSITRVRGLTHDQKTTFMLYVNNRPRMEPPLPNDYFGASINVVSAEAKAGELVENDLGWTAWKVHLAVANFNDSVVRKLLKDWLQSPLVFQPSLHFDPCTVVMSSSPRFNMYGNEFGMGKAVAVRSGCANKFDGWLTAYEGYEGGGSIDLAVCLLPDAMTALESDEEFMEAVSESNLLPL